MNPVLQQIMAAMMGGQQQVAGPVGMSRPPVVNDDPPMRVDQDTARELWNLHEKVKKTNPALAKQLWQSIQPFTGDF
jgi:hypothetical protein